MSDVIFHADLNSAELGAIRLALNSWRLTARSNAEVMEKLGAEAEPIIAADKARRNVEASRHFEREASELLAKLEPEALRVTVTRPSAEIMAELLEEPSDAERGPYPVNPGEIFYSSWGYDQTNVDFYRVVLRKEAGGHEWVKLEQLEKVETSDDTEDRPATMTGRVVPADPIKPIGKPAFLRKLHPNGNSPFVKLNSYAFAYPWDGSPKRVSHYG